MSFLLGIIVVLLASISWTLDSKLSAILRELKNNSQNDTLNSIDENVDILVRLKTGTARWNGEHFEDVFTPKK